MKINERNADLVTVDWGLLEDLCRSVSVQELDKMLERYARRYRQRQQAMAALDEQVAK